MFSSKTLSLLGVMTVAVHSVSAFSLSTQCQGTLVNLVTSPDTDCLDPQALVGLVTAGDNSSVISPFNNWLTGMCAQSACTNETLAAVISNVTTGCSSDLQSLGVSLNANEITPIVQMVYPGSRKAACLADSSDNNTMCLTETLTNLQKSAGTLSLTKIFTLVSQAQAGNYPNVSQSITCSNCTKAAFDVLDQAFPSVLSAADKNITGTCGSSFLDGPQPATITQMANSAIASNVSSGAILDASIHSSLRVALPSLLMVSSAFAIFA